MASFLRNIWNKKVYDDISHESPEEKEEIKPDEPSFYEKVSNFFYTNPGEWGTINSIKKTNDGGVRLSISITPSYLFPKTLTKDGFLTIGEYISKVSHISVSFNIGLNV
jgi:hypothetical protein